MIRKMSHATIFVKNQNEALEFYRDKLGFKVHTDAMVGDDFRWLTISKSTLRALTRIFQRWQEGLAITR